MTAELNLKLLGEIEENRAFLLLAYASNPQLLARAELRIRQLFEPLPDALAPTQTTPVVDVRSRRRK
ncbi:MAG: hypothetical protein OEM00_08755 [Burkholderiaceae bacterium]|nr:hypothetical protein [Burkholderiaceae bacterium]